MCWGEVAILFFILFFKIFGCEHVMFDFEFFRWVYVSF